MAGWIRYWHINRRCCFYCCSYIRCRYQTRTDNQTKFIPCGAHQLDLAVQNSFEVSLRSSFHSIFHRFTSYLRRQTNFKAAIRSVCPKQATTRWLSMGLVCRWIISHRHDIQSYVNEKGQQQNPTDS